MKKLILLCCALAIAAAPASAQLRMFPQNAPRGYLAPSPQQGHLLLNGKEIRLTPAIQIRDQNNTIIFASMLEKEVVVKYQLEGEALHRAWILTPYEYAQPDRFKLPTRLYESQ